ncbi:MAG: T9SS C-terminal target domain-containing protein, partial [Bacteroidetes bacterium]
AFSIFAETGQKYQYSWTPFLGLSNPFAPNPVTTTPVTTSYVLTVIDDCGTTTTDTVVVTVGTPPVVTTNVSPAFASLNNGAVGLNISGGTAPFTYLWSNGATTDSVSGLAPGSYSVTVSDARGCSVVVTARVDDKTGIEDLGISNLLIYPNPSSGIVNVEMKLNSADKVSLGVYDMNGRQLFETSSEVTASWNRSIDLSRLAAGVYMLKVTTSRGNSYQRITLE